MGLAADPMLCPPISNLPPARLIAAEIELVEALGLLTMSPVMASVPPLILTSPVEVLVPVVPVAPKVREPTVSVPFVPALRVSVPLAGCRPVRAMLIVPALKLPFPKTIDPVEVPVLPLPPALPVAMLMVLIVPFTVPAEKSAVPTMPEEVEPPLS